MRRYNAVPSVQSMNGERPIAGTYPRAAAGARRTGSLAAGLLTLAVMAGCTQTSRMHTGSIASSTSTAPVTSLQSMNVDELNNALRAYGANYDRNPKDKATGLTYASALQMAGRNDQSLAVMQQVAINFPNDRDVLSAYGKALAAAGDLPKALETVRRAQTPDFPDWRLLSAEGAILDQLGQQDKARILYGKALTIQPNEASVLSNLGLSYLLSNDLKRAEGYLTQAAAQPGADSRVRQNLALAIALQGRFAEAEKVASQDLSPDEAAGNMAFLREMLSQRNTWADLKAEKRG